MPVEVRLYDRLFKVERPDLAEEDFKSLLNPQSLEILADSRIEPAAVDPALGERLQLILTHGTRHGQIELPISAVLGSTESPMARNELRLRLKRATDTMLFKPMPDHRIAVKPVAPPGGATTFRSPRGRR